MYPAVRIGGILQCLDGATRIYMYISVESQTIGGEKRVITGAALPIYGN